MKKLQNKNILITGANRGLGRAILNQLLAENATISVISRDEQKLAHLAAPNLRIFKGDVTDEDVINGVIFKVKPDVIILNAGATPVMGSLEEQTWESFTTTWNTDVKAGLYGIQAALTAPLAPGSKVIIITSGAAMVGAPLSGSYAGAKRMLWFMAQYANEIAQKKKLGITFQLIVPMQMIAETALAQTVASAYAGPQGVTVEKYIENRYGEPLTAGEYAAHVVSILTDSAYINGFAYGIRKDNGIALINY